MLSSYLTAPCVVVLFDICAKPQPTQVQLLSQPAEAGYKNESIPIELRIKIPNVVQLIRMFTACYLLSFLYYSSQSSWWVFIKKSLYFMQTKGDWGNLLLTNAITRRFLPSRRWFLSVCQMALDMSVGLWHWAYIITTIVNTPKMEEKLMPCG